MAHERREIPLAEWQAEGLRRFGRDPLDWRFKCVICGHVQDGRGMMERHNISQDEALSRSSFSCEGRLGGEEGCDWSLGGLFKLHTVEIVHPDGSREPVFEFACEESGE